jgi:hypothetical protein
MATHGRFLTTHVGSLPRPDDLKEMMWAREDGTPVDTAALEERVRRAVDEVVARQTKAGIDIVNDGEWGKPSSRPASSWVPRTGRHALPSGYRRLWKNARTSSTHSFGCSRAGK